MKRKRTCDVTGVTTSTNNFYVNENANDNLHPYHKDFDNFRRTTGSSVEQVRKLITLINN